MLLTSFFCGVSVMQASLVYMLSYFCDQMCLFMLACLGKASERDCLRQHVGSSSDRVRSE